MARTIVLCLVLMLSTCFVYAAIPDCLLPKVTGDCQKKIRAFYFDSESRLCRPFVYTGCKGNGNRFYSRDECQFACHYYLRLQPKNW